MNIAFFGTSDKSIPILEALKNSEFNLQLCVTKDDVKIGRKQILKPTAVKIWAKDNGVHCVTIKEMDAQGTQQTINSLNDKNIEMGVVADFSFMIPESIFTLPKHKLINIHFSLLPKYRGASPVQFAILNRDKETGVSFQIISKGMDEGSLINQINFPLKGTETTESLYEELFELAAKELPLALKTYSEGKTEPTEQDESKATYTYSPTNSKSTLISKKDAEIDWGKSPEEIDSMVRAFNPWPITWTTLEELGKTYALKESVNPSLKVKIFETAIENENLIMKTVQVEGKNKLNWNEFSNGYLSEDSAATSDA